MIKKSPTVLNYWGWYFRKFQLIVLIAIGTEHFQLNTEHYLIKTALFLQSGKHLR